jgi:hypothetical protein
VISVSSPLSASAAVERIRALVAPPVAKTFSLAHGLQGRVGEDSFVAWCRSPLQRYPLVRATGRITTQASGCEIAASVPIAPRCPGLVAAALWLAFLVTFVLAALPFFDPRVSTKMPVFVPAALGAAGFVCLMSLRARSEAEELQRALGSALRTLETRSDPR